MVLDAPSHLLIFILVHLVGAIKAHSTPNLWQISYMALLERRDSCVCLCVCARSCAVYFRQTFCKIPIDKINKIWLTSLLLHTAPALRPILCTCTSRGPPWPSRLHTPQTLTSSRVCLWDKHMQNHWSLSLKVRKRTIKVANPILNCASNLIFRPWYMYWIFFFFDKED